VSDDTVEAILVFRGVNAKINADAFMEYMDTINGIGELVNGIKYHGGTVASIDDTEGINKIVVT